MADALAAPTLPVEERWLDQQGLSSLRAAASCGTRGKMTWQSSFRASFSGTICNWQPHHVPQPFDAEHVARRVEGKGEADVDAESSTLCHDQAGRKAAPSWRTAAPLPGRNFYPPAVAEAIAVAIAKAVAYSIPGLRTRL